MLQLVVAGCQRRPESSYLSVGKGVQRGWRLKRLRLTKRARPIAIPRDLAGAIRL